MHLFHFSDIYCKTYVKKMDLKTLITETIKEVINEFRYQDTATHLNSKDLRYRNIGKNPLAVDNGGHSSNDVLSQPSTFDRNGATFRSEDNIVLSDNKFTIYKIKNFGTDKINSTMDLFGKGTNGEKSFRKEIDIMNGAATRNSINLLYRTITSVSNASKSKSTGGMINTFWEFSYDNGNTWYVMKPNGTQEMRASKLVRKQ